MDNKMNVLYLLLILAFVLSISFLDPSTKFNDTFFSYFMMIGLSSSLALIAQNMPDKRVSYLLLALGIAVVWLPFSLRGNMGTDDRTYENIFSLVAENGWIKRFFKSTMEPGYLLLNNICYFITSNYNFCRFVCATIPFVVIYCSLIKFKDNLYWFFAVLYIVSSPFFIIFEAGLVRIFIAISIVFYGYRYLYEEDTKKYLICILIAMLFHYAAGIMLIFTLLLVNGGKYVRKPLTTGLILGLFLILILFAIDYAVTHFLGARYIAYTMKDNDMKLSIMSFDTLPFVIYGIFSRKIIPENHKRFYDSLLIILTIGSAVSVLSSIIPIGRSAFFLNLSIVFLVSYWYKYYEESLIKFAIVSVFVSYCFVYAYLGKLSSCDNSLYPYVGYFSNIIN